MESEVRKRVKSRNFQMEKMTFQMEVIKVCFHQKHSQKFQIMMSG